MAIDTLLDKPHHAGIRRVGVYKKDAPHMVMQAEGGDMILLPMPSNITSNDVPLWEMGEYGSKIEEMFGKGMATMDYAQKALQNTTGADIVGLIAKHTGQAMRGGLDLVMHKQGIMYAPQKELLFRGADFRTFSFDFDFISTNKREAKEVNNLIYELQYHSLPEIDAGVQSYPHLWSLGWKNTRYLPVIMKSALTNMSVNYTGIGKPVFHEGDAPVQVNVTLEFTETEIHTRSKVENDVWG